VELASHKDVRELEITPVQMMDQAQRYQLRLIPGHLVESQTMLTVQPGMAYR
jgi:hypothetical protein